MALFDVKPETHLRFSIARLNHALTARMVAGPSAGPHPEGIMPCGCPAPPSSPRSLSRLPCGLCVRCAQGLCTMVARFFSPHHGHDHHQTQDGRVCVSAKGRDGAGLGFRPARVRAPPALPGAHHVAATTGAAGATGCVSGTVEPGMLPRASPAEAEVLRREMVRLRREICASQRALSDARAAVLGSPMPPTSAASPSSAEQRGRTPPALRALARGLGKDSHNSLGLGIGPGSTVQDVADLLRQEESHSHACRAAEQRPASPNTPILEAGLSPDLGAVAVLGEQGDVPQWETFARQPTPMHCRRALVPTAFILPPGSCCVLGHPPPAYRHTGTGILVAILLSVLQCPCTGAFSLSVPPPMHRHLEFAAHASGLNWSKAITAALGTDTATSPRGFVRELSRALTKAGFRRMGPGAFRAATAENFEFYLPWQLEDRLDLGPFLDHYGKGPVGSMLLYTRGGFFWRQKIDMGMSMAYAALRTRLVGWGPTAWLGNALPQSSLANRSKLDAGEARRHKLAQAAAPGEQKDGSPSPGPEGTSIFHAEAVERRSLRAAIDKEGFLRTLPRKVQLQEPIVSDVVLAYKREVDAKVSVHRYMDVPLADVDALLPMRGVDLQPVDRLIWIVQLLLMLFFLKECAEDLYEDVTAANRQCTWSGVAFLAAMLVAILGRVHQLWFNYQIKVSSYLAEHTRWLRAHRASQGLSVVHDLLSAVAEQELKELLLAYWWLWQQGPMTEQQLDRQVERFVSEELGEKTDFDAPDALAKLGQLHLVSGPGSDGAYAVTEPPSKLDFWLGVDFRDC
eukprot:gene8301-204_t